MKELFIDLGKALYDVVRLSFLIVIRIFKFIIGEVVYAMANANREAQSRSTQVSSNPKYGDPGTMDMGIIERKRTSINLPGKLDCGFVETDPNTGDVTAYVDGGRPVGTYIPSSNLTVDLDGHPIANGDVTASLVYQHGLKEQQDD